MSACVLMAQDGGAVRLDLPDGNGSLLLPSVQEPGWEKAALQIATRFQGSWTTLFGTRAEMPSGVAVPSGMSLREGVFEALWAAASPALSPVDAPAARAAMRESVLGDEAPLTEALVTAIRSGRIDAACIQGPLLYQFLTHELEDRAFLPKALPPGEGASRLRDALSQRGASWNQFVNRFAGWVLSSALERHILPSSPTGLPAVWLLDANLKPGEFAAWKIPLSDPTSGVDVQVSGEAPAGLRLLSIFLDGQGHVAQCGVCDLAAAPSLLPRQGQSLWLFLWNASGQESGSGLTLTLWKDYQPPFLTRGASVHDRGVDLTLEERAGIADYRLFARPDAEHAFRPLAAEPFASDGAGTHHYRIVLREPVPASGDLKLTCRMISGGQYGTLLKAGDAEP